MHTEVFVGETSWKATTWKTKKDIGDGIKMDLNEIAFEYMD
jgi:hypothetical protein